MAAASRARRPSGRARGPPRRRRRYSCGSSCSGLLFDWYFDCVAVEVELAPAGVDLDLPVARGRQVGPSDDVRTRLHAGSGPVAQRTDVLRLQEGRHPHLVAPALGELEMDVVPPEHPGLDL